MQIKISIKRRQQLSLYDVATQNTRLPISWQTTIVNIFRSKMEVQQQELLEIIINKGDKILFQDIETCLQGLSLDEQLEQITINRNGRNSIAQLLSCLHNQWYYEQASPDEGDPDFVAQCCDLIGFLIRKCIELCKTNYMYQTYETELIDYQYECTLANGDTFSGNAQQLVLKLHQETAIEAFINQHYAFTIKINESGSSRTQQETVLLMTHFPNL